MIFSKTDIHIGLIGIGNMGTPMAANLIKAGWKVVVFDNDQQKINACVKAQGASAASGLSELASRCKVIITMLPDGHIVRRVILGKTPEDDHLAKKIQKGAVIIDMSSSAPVGTRELGAELEKIGIALLDAPVSGGVKGAIAGTLAIMVGGDSALTRSVDELLSALGKRFYVGALGSGHAAKVLNNYVSAAGLVAAAEAVRIAESFGIEPQTLINVINASTGRNNSTENKFAQFILNKKFNSGFAMSLMAKDLSLAMEVAKACNVPAELGHTTLDMWKKAENTLGSGADHTEIARYVNSAK
jgi:3-hydroxyisobutyrate dehydrogenase